MIKIENTEVIGWEHAIRGMRNPKNSWDRSDTAYCYDIPSCSECPSHLRGSCEMGKDVTMCIGPNDYKLMMQLAAGGPVHAKYRRMIAVYVDITAPLYWWKEFDTYKVGTVANSCSTMHKIHDKEFTVEDFSCEHLMTDSGNVKNSNVPLLQDPNDYDNAFDPTNVFVLTMNMLNACRRRYLDIDEKLKKMHFNQLDERKELVKLKKQLWWQMIQLLPSSYNQKRTIMLNYEVLAGIYPMRKNHKLDEWHYFCEWIDSLPYSEIITGPKFLNKKMNILEIPDKPVEEVKEEVSSEIANEVSETAGDGKCTICNGTGVVQVAPNARGIKICPACNGTGTVTGKRGE